MEDLDTSLRQASVWFLFNSLHVQVMVLLFQSGASGDEDQSSLVVHRDCVEQQWRILTLLSDRLLFGFCSIVYMFK